MYFSGITWGDQTLFEYLSFIFYCLYNFLIPLAFKHMDNEYGFLLYHLVTWRTPRSTSPRPRWLSLDSRLPRRETMSSLTSTLSLTNKWIVFLILFFRRPLCSFVVVWSRFRIKSRLNYVNCTDGRREQ